jgi:acetoin utilization deacetylase AcuC-like enzyme
MSLLYLSHPTCELHDMGTGHPESPERLKMIQQAIDNADWKNQLTMQEAPLLPVEQLYNIHPKNFVEAIVEQSPEQGIVHIGPDVALNNHSVSAARYAAGAAIYATQQVISGQHDAAFCAVRPPGHHAESAVAMGFCLFNSAALAAEAALQQGMQRVAILDFDVHHGNGTVEIFQDRPEVLVCSSFQYPFYPSRFDDISRDNIILTPLSQGCDSSTFRKAIERDWLAAIQHFRPECIIISAGFDAHIKDPLGGLALQTEDFLWITQLIKNCAVQYSDSKIISLLEGGYHLQALADAVIVHVKELL